MTQSPSNSPDSGASPEEVDDLIDEWGEDSFPASDPPGTLPPSLAREDEEAGDRKHN